METRHKESLHVHGDHCVDDVNVLGESVEDASEWGGVKKLSGRPEHI